MSRSGPQARFIRGNVTLCTRREHFADFKAQELLLVRQVVTGCNSLAQIGALVVSLLWWCMALSSRLLIDCVGQLRRVERRVVSLYLTDWFFVDYDLQIELHRFICLLNGYINGLVFSQSCLFLHFFESVVRAESPTAYRQLQLLRHCR